jgi:hypothetical protein
VGFCTGISVWEISFFFEIWFFKHIQREANDCPPPQVVPMIIQYIINSFLYELSSHQISYIYLQWFISYYYCQSES